MDTVQIIIYSILFIGDVYFSFALSSKKQSVIMLINGMRLILTFAIIVAFTLALNREIKKSQKEKCPEYERATDVYKIKP